MTGHLLSVLSGIGPGLANHLWQSTAFATGVWLLTLLLCNNRARIRYWLWLVASLKFLLPFSLLIALGSLLPRPRHAPAGPQPALYSAVNVAAQPFSANVLPVVAHAASLREHFTEWLPLALLAVWLCGALTVFLIWHRRWRQVSATLRRAEPIDGGRELEILRRLERGSDGRGGIASRRVLPLRLSRELMEPGVFGVFRPVLIWPERLSGHLEDEHIEAILAHEAMHARRRDNLTAALHMLVETLFWFHPLVWWMERRMVEERERACDEAVVEMGGDRETYAEGLLKACRFCVESPLACVSGVTGADLSRRVHSIMKPRLEKLSRGKKVLLGVLGSMAVVAPIMFGQAAITAPLPAKRAPNATPLSLSFDVVSIKRNKTATGLALIDSPLNGDAITITNMSPHMMIGLAFDLPLHDEIYGLPSWTDTEHYDVEAKVPASELPDFHKLLPRQRNPMLQKVLYDRFHLKYHYESRMLTVYELQIAKNGSRLEAIEPGILSNGLKNSGAMHGGRGEITAEGVSMEDFSQVLAQQVGRPVADKTGLNGNYNFKLTWMPGLGSAATPSNADSGPSIFTAMQEQLGLKLTAAKLPVQTLVVDHIERPSEN